MVERIDKIQELLKTSPTDNFLRHALALEYIKLENDGPARILFEAILLHDENFVGSYYHLGRLLERIDEPALAVHWYKKGMEAAKRMGEQRAYNELKSAYEELIY
jgi:Tfp pilus assembly protein PilF